jgi:hypothetical protein
VLLSWDVIVGRYKRYWNVFALVSFALARRLSAEVREHWGLAGGAGPEE